MAIVNISSPSILGSGPAVSPITIVQQRSLAGFVADAVIEEVHTDDAMVTDHPVESGSTISDNMVDLPSELSLVYAWGMAGAGNTSSSPNYLREIYAAILTLKTQKQLVNIYTGKRSYQNMVLRSVSLTTDKDTEEALVLRLGCRQLIIVSTSTFSLPTTKSQVASPQTGMQTAKMGQQQTVPVSPTPSALSKIGSFLTRTFGHDTSDFGSIQ